MRSESVIVLAPDFTLLPCILEVEEDVTVQALVAQAAIEALNKGVLGQPAWPDEVQLHLMLVSLGIPAPGCKTRHRCRR